MRRGREIAAIPAAFTVGRFPVRFTGTPHGEPLSAWLPERRPDVLLATSRRPLNEALLSCPGLRGPHGPAASGVKAATRAPVPRFRALVFSAPNSHRNLVAQHKCRARSCRSLTFFMLPQRMRAGIPLPHKLRREAVVRTHSSSLRGDAPRTPRCPRLGGPMAKTAIVSARPARTSSSLRPRRRQHIPRLVGTKRDKKARILPKTQYKFAGRRPEPPSTGHFLLLSGLSAAGSAPARARGAAGLVEAADDLLAEQLDVRHVGRAVDVEVDRVRALAGQVLDDPDHVAGVAGDAGGEQAGARLAE